MREGFSHSDTNVIVERLPNGMTVAFEHLPYLHSVTAGMWVRAGSAHEPAAQSGVSHLLEHLFFKGTATRTTRQLMDVIEGRGGHLNAFTSRENTCLYVKTLDNHIASGLDILADIVKNSQFFDLEKERNVVLEEIASGMDVPEDYVHDLFALRLWPDHGLGRPVGGTAKTVAGITLEDVRSYYAARYRPAGMIFAVVGNMDMDVIRRQVHAEFGALPAGDGGEEYTAPECSTGLAEVPRDIAQTHLCFGYPGPTVHDPRRYAFDMLSNALGGGVTSRLFERIRENEGLAYSVYSFFSTYLTSGMLGVYAAVAPENLARVVEMTSEELKKLCDKPVSPDELESNREQLKGHMLMALESPFNRMNRIAKSLMYYGRVLTLEEVVAQVDAVTSEDIQRLAQETFRPERCAIALLGPTNNLVVEGLPA